MNIRMSLRGVYDEASLKHGFKLRLLRSARNDSTFVTKI